MKKRQTSRKIFGILLIILGTIGLFLPLLQGILLILAGLALLDEKLPIRIKKLLKKFKLQSEKLKIFFIFSRYLILLALMFSLPLIYKTFTPLTLYPSAFLLDLFYDIAVYNLMIIINAKTFIQLIPACIAGSAYLLLLILNLSLPMKIDKRIYSIIVSFLALLILNILRIFILSVLYHNDFIFFDFTHRAFWYIGSTLFVIAIWFFIVKIFSIKEIPVYDDFRYLMKNIS